MHPTLNLLKQQLRVQHVRRGMLGGIRAKFAYPIREPEQKLPVIKEKKPKKVREKPPYMEQRTYKQANKGLYAGAHIQFGNQISEFGNKSRRTWKPNVHPVKLYSEALDRRLEIRCTPRVLKTIDQKGGLDKYLLGIRDNELGKKMYYLKYAINNIIEGKGNEVPSREDKLLESGKRLLESKKRLSLESEKKLSLEGGPKQKNDGNKE
ncbi:10867_t:CDS:1 [Acaulospora morrowiae]|uniref:Large ribosomal subunit protein bL28m n=1 Tax=Acaulospora morrowiae TaxID=94023 RepID=A0A9N8ZDB9_9GLOM|nr:10867_t:CDS:1 [Acaulospora morrowiae]